MIVTHLVLPFGLAPELVKSSTRGEMRGRYVPGERLMAVISGRVVGKGEEIFSSGSRRIFQHWAFDCSGGEDIPLPWVQVKEGFSEAWRDRALKTPDDLDAWTTDGDAHPQQPDIYSVCCIEPFQESFYPFLVVCIPKNRTFRGEVELLASTPHLPTTMDGLSPIQALKNNQVAIIGLGSGGSAVALSLAAAGVGTLHLFDHDHLSLDNLHRHACDLRHVGRAKVLAMRDLIADYNLPAKVFSHDIDIVKEAEQLWEVAAKVDLLICATDTVPSRRLLNYVAVHTATPLVMGCAFENARIGEIIRVLPNAACYECVRRYLMSSGALVPGDRTGRGERISYARDASAPTPTAHTGTRVDISLIAALQSKVIITTLLRLPKIVEGNEDDAKAGGTAAYSEPDLPANYLAWGASVDAKNQEHREPFTFALPFSVNWFHLTRDEECPVCGDLGRGEDVDLDQRYADIMAAVQSVEEDN